MCAGSLSAEIESVLVFFRLSRPSSKGAAVKEIERRTCDKKKGSIPGQIQKDPETDAGRCCSFSRGESPSLLPAAIRSSHDALSLVERWMGGGGGRRRRTRRDYFGRGNFIGFVSRKVPETAMDWALHQSVSATTQ